VSWLDRLVDRFLLASDREVWAWFLVAALLLLVGGAVVITWLDGRHP